MWGEAVHRRAMTPCSEGSRAALATPVGIAMPGEGKETPWVVARRGSKATRRGMSCNGKGSACVWGGGEGRGIVACVMFCLRA